MCKLIVASLAFFAAAAAALGQPVAEFALARPNSQPTAIAAGPDGAMWFAETGAIGRITGFGVISEFPVGDEFLGGIAAGPDGALWFTQGDSIGRMTIAGKLTRFPVPASGGFLSHIVAGPDGALWYVRRNTGRIGRITTSGQVEEFEAISEGTGASIYGLATGPEGALWFTSSRGIGRLTIGGDATLLSEPRRIGVFTITASADALWFPDCHLFPKLSCDVGRLTTQGALTMIPVGASGGWADMSIVVAADGTLWFNEFDRIGVVAPDGAFREISIPTPNSHITGIAAGTDGAIWFTELDGNKIGRVGGDVHCGGPDLLCLQQGAYEVAASWTKPDGSGGTGHPVPLSNESGYFWFFEPGNVEVVVKVLNGCPVNGHAWFFGAGMTNLAVTLTVRDVASGEARQYSSPAGPPFVPIIDMATFPTCAAQASPPDGVE